MTGSIPDARTEPTITVPRAGELLGLCRSSAYEAAKRGEIPTLSIGRRKVVPTAKFLDMLGLGPALEARPTSAPPARTPSAVRLVYSAVPASHPA